MILGLTFDFWDTLVVDDSDEDVRRAQGLLPKVEARRLLFWEEIERAYDVQIAKEDALAALAEADAWCKARWKEDHITPTVTERLEKAYELLGVEKSEGFDALVRRIERLEVETPPRLAEGIAEALHALKGRYRLGIISDTIITPGRGLKEILAGYDLLDCFDAFIFSDEVGCSKPDPRIYQYAAEALGLPLAAVAHIGDREANDVQGPLAVGMKGILYTGIIDRSTPETQASARYDDHRKLPALLDELNEKTSSALPSTQKALEGLAETFVSRFPLHREKPRLVGREAEYPVVLANGEAADIQRLWPLLLEDPSLRPLKEGDLIVGVEGKDYSYALEVGWGTIEVITGPCPDLLSLKAQHEAAMKALFTATERLNYKVLGYGVQPKTPPTQALMSPKPRYAMLGQGIGQAWLWFTATASDQLQVDIRREEIIPASNLANLLTPVLIALCANSPICAGEISPWLSSREGTMGQIYQASHRHGMPARALRDPLDWIETLAKHRFLVRKKDGQFFPQEGTFLEYISKYPALFEDFLTHEHYIWNSARPRCAHGTIEIRAACQQPWSAHTAVTAFGLGVIEAWRELAGWLEDALGDALWPRFLDYHHRVLHEGLRAEEPLSGLIAGVLERMEAALDARGFGEAPLLAPLKERLEKRQSPADQAIAAFRSGGWDALLQLLTCRTETS